ncbi:MAG TPA: dephospho-CoA kinase, partial [Noviherbaspirillum sp.]
LAHRLTAPSGAAIPAVHAEFGPAFLTADSALDRAKMREHVFTEPAARKRLEAILHPLIRIECERAARETEGVYLMFVVPLLVESGGWRERVDRVLVVDIPEAEQVRRVVQRSGLQEAQVQAIMEAQASRSQRLESADDLIDNSGSPQSLDDQVATLHARYLALARSNTRQ